MSTLAEKLLATFTVSMAAGNDMPPPPPRKRGRSPPPQDDDDDANEDGDRPAKRARLGDDEDDAMPPRPPRKRGRSPPPPRDDDEDPAQDGGGDGDGDGEHEEEPPAKRARRGGGGDEERVRTTSIENEGLFTPLHHIYKERVREEMADMIEAEAARRPITCFFCECGETNLESEAGVATWAVGYNLMINYIRAYWAIRDPIAVCKEVVRLYDRHIYDPCVRASGGQVPPNLPRLTTEDVLVHVRDHTRHPLVTQMLLMDTLKQLVVGLSARAFVNTVPDVRVVTTLLTAVARLDAMNDKCRALFDKEADLVLDPLRVNALANVHRLESLRQRSGDALGGATATGSTASTAATAVLEARPAFGHAAYQRAQQHDSVDESDVGAADM